MGASMKVLLGNSLSKDLREFFNQAALEGQIEIVNAQMAKYTSSAAFAEDIGDVDGEPVVIIQSAGPSAGNSANDYAMQLALAVDALKNQAGASSVWVIMPHYGFDRQDKSRPNRNDGIGARAMAKMLQAVGADGFSVVEAHSEKAVDHVKGVFGDDNVYNLDPSELYAEQLKELGLEDALVSGPDAGSDPRADHLETLLHGEESEVSVRFRKHRTGDQRDETELDEVEGEIEGRDLVIVDDVFDTGGTISKAGRYAKDEGGAKSVSALAAAGTFGKKGLQNMFEAKSKTTGAPVFDNIFVLDTVDAEPALSDLERIYHNARERVTVLPSGQLLLDHIKNDLESHPVMKSAIKPK